MEAAYLLSRSMKLSSRVAKVKPGGSCRDVCLEGEQGVIHEHTWHYWL